MQRYFLCSGVNCTKSNIESRHVHQVLGVLKLSQSLKRDKKILLNFFLEHYDITLFDLFVKM